MRADEARMQRGQLEESEEDGGPEGSAHLKSQMSRKKFY